MSEDIPIARFQNMVVRATVSTYIFGPLLGLIVEVLVHFCLGLGQLRPRVGDLLDNKNPGVVVVNPTVAVRQATETKVP